MYRLFYDTGAIYDVPAFFVLFAAFVAATVGIRKSGRVPGLLETLGLVALFIAALNSQGNCGQAAALRPFIDRGSSDANAYRWQG